MFVGRAPELARLDAAFRRVRAGGSATVLIGGEAGIGKSRLVERALAAPRSSGAAILVGACLEFGEASLPFAPIAEALRGLIRSLDPATLPAVLGPARGELARLLPELGEREAQRPDETERAARARLFEAVATVVDRLAARAPVVFVVEDVHWADASTRDLLRFLVSRLRRSRVLFGLTFRSDDLALEHPLLGWLAELERDGAARIELEGLDRPEIRELASAVLGVPVSNRFAQRLHQRTDGNPFFADALLAVLATPAAVRDGRTAPDPATLLARLDEPLPPGLRDVLGARIAELDERTADVLRAAAIAGPKIDDRVLSGVLGRSVRSIGRALREAVERGILVVLRGPDGVSGFGFRHELIRDVVRSELGPGERRELHASFGRVLEEGFGGDGETGEHGEAPWAELAYHWDQAGDARRALVALVHAAIVADRAYAYEDARRHARRALELWSRVPSPELLVPVDRIGLLERAAIASSLLGDYEPAIRDARAAYRDAVAAGEEHRASLLHERLRWILWESGDRAGALAEVERALDRVAKEGQTATRAKVLAHLAGLRLFAGDLPAARSAAQEAIEIAHAVDARPEEAIALGVLGWVRALEGEVDKGLADFRHAIRIAEELGSVEGLGTGHANLAALLDRIGRPSEALAAALEGLDVARRLGVERTYGGQLRGSAAKALYALGRWDESERVTDEGLELDPAGPAAIFLHTVRARLDASRGRFADADAHLEAARRLDDALGGTQYRGVLLAAAAERAVWDGRLSDARVAVSEGLGLERPDALPDPGLAWLAALGLRAEADAAERARIRRDERALEDALARAREIAARLPSPDDVPQAAWEGRGRAFLALCAAELARVDGQDGADPPAWEEAALAWEAVERPFPAAYCRARQAEAMLATRGARETARASLASAHVAATRLGAAPLLAEVDLLARHARLDMSSPEAKPVEEAPRKGSKDDPLDALGFTARELEVLRLVAGGWSNQQIADALFITRKTASVHVSNILGKLGVASRVEAAAIAHRLGLGRDVPSPPGSEPLA